MKERIAITEEWLKAMGFRWHQHERQPNKMWLLWIGDVERPHRMFNGPDDVGIELSCSGAKYPRGPEKPPEWFCWLRSDVAGLYHRFLHVRHLTYRDELAQLILGLTGQRLRAQNNLYGSMPHPRVAAKLRENARRLDLRMREQRAKWYDAENDPTRAGALPEHLDDALHGRKCE